MRATLCIAILALTCTYDQISIAAENWKGEPYPNPLSVSATAGLGVIDGSTGLGLNGSFAAKVLNNGFIEDINDQLHVELTLGTLLLNDSSAFVWSTHLRWDFHLDEEWSFFPIGGISGNKLSQTLGGGSQVFLRFGVGALWHLFEKFSFRAELSHEFSGLGLYVNI